MAAVNVPMFHDLPDRSTPVTAAAMNEWGTAIKGNATAAEAARDDAIAAAAAAVAPTDTMMAAKAADAGSEFRAAGDGVYGPIVTVLKHAPVGVGDATTALASLMTDAAVVIDANGPRGHDATLKPVRSVARIPAGVWNTSAKIVLPAGVSLELDPAAVIRATAAISGALIETAEDAWEGQFIRGGVIDCNGYAQDGILVRLGRYSSVRDVLVTDPTRHGLILGDTGLSASSFEMKLDAVTVRRRDGWTVQSGSIGVNLAKCSDSTLDHVISVGFETGFRNGGGDNRLDKCHCWGYPGAFPMTAFLDATGSHSSYSQCVADSPSAYGFRSMYGYITLSQCHVFLASTQTDNAVVGLRVDSGSSYVQTFGNRFQGYSAGVRLKADIEGGDTTWLNTSSVLGQISAYVVTPLSTTRNRLPATEGAIGSYVPVFLNFAGTIGAYPTGTWVAPKPTRFTSISTRRGSGSGNLTLSIEKAGTGAVLAAAIPIGSTRAACDFTLAAGEAFYVHCTDLGTTPVGLSITFEAYQA